MRRPYAKRQSFVACTYSSSPFHSTKPSSPLQTEGQLHFFSQQLLPHSLAASQACAAAVSSYSSSTAAPTDTGNPWRVTMSSLRSFKLPIPRSAQGGETGEPEEGGTGEPEEGGTVQGSSQMAWRNWAAEAPWDHWADYDDPVGMLCSFAVPWRRFDLPWFFGTCPRLFASTTRNVSWVLPRQVTSLADRTIRMLVCSHC